MLTVLGSEKRKFLFSCQGELQKHMAQEVIKNFINFIGMTSAREPRIDEYPYEEKGGIGYTGFFPLTESYVMLDVYSDLMEVEILVSTCKPERLYPSAVVSFLTKHIGPTTFKGVL